MRPAVSRLRRVDKDRGLAGCGFRCAALPSFNALVGRRWLPANYLGIARPQRFEESAKSEAILQRDRRGIIAGLIFGARMLVSRNRADAMAIVEAAGLRTMYIYVCSFCVVL